MKLMVASDERTKLTDFVVDYLKEKGNQKLPGWPENKNLASREPCFHCVKVG